VPHLPEDYIHRVGRTARADATGDAFTFVSPEEEQDLAAIERAVGKRLPRVILPDFDYASRPKQRFEVPIAERIAEIRARKAEERKRAKEKLARKAASAAGQASGVKRAAPADAGKRNGGSPVKSDDGSRASRPPRRGRRRGGGTGGGGSQRPGGSGGPYR
jgi:ATP-dependent RNA helicase RhlE